MKTLTVTVAAIAIAAAMPAHAVSEHLCNRLRPAMVSIAQARDAGVPTETLYKKADAFAVQGAPSVPQLRPLMRSMVALAVSQPNEEPEHIADGFVKRCAAYRGDLAP